MGLPKISINLALSADGKISSVTHRPSGWTSKEDHHRLLELRRNADALLVGRGTLESDHMTLTVPEKSHQPLRCIVSNTANFDFSHPVFHHPGGPIHLLATSPHATGTPPSGVTLHRQSLIDFLQTLADQFAVQNLHCEGGGQLINSLMALDLVDQFHLTLAGHTIFGGQLAPTATGIPEGFFETSRSYQIAHFEPRPDLGECFLTYTRQRNSTQ